MATFQQWLAGNEGGPQDDPVAWLARAWKSQEGKRPRVSSASGIEKHMLTLAAGEPAQQDQWTGYVHLAVNAAVDKFRAEKSTPAPAGVQQELPGAEPQGDRNPVTGKPVAIVAQAQWRRYPDASVLGSCEVCGWARGFADLGQGKGEQMMCAAGHVFEAQLPGPTGQADLPASGAATPASAGSGLPSSGEETSAVLSGPLTPIVGDGGAGAVDPDAKVWKALDGPDSEPVDLLALVNLKLTVLLVSMGLPTDPQQMGELLLAAAEAQQQDAGTDSLAGQLGATVLDHVGTGHAALPPGFAAWYGVADPAAESDGPA